MTEEQKTAWVEALRSGKYEQTYGELHIPDSNKYCSLGVLAYATGTLRGGQLVLSPINLVEGSFFIILNDVIGLTFEEIALVIENVPDSQWEDYPD